MKTIDEETLWVIFSILRANCITFKLLLLEDKDISISSELRSTSKTGLDANIRVMSHLYSIHKEFIDTKIKDDPTISDLQKSLQSVVEI